MTGTAALLGHTPTATLDSGSTVAPDTTQEAPDA